MNPRALIRRRFLAFTLIELITVIAIIAILMALLIPGLFIGKKAAMEARARTAIAAIIPACNAYATDYGKYPPIPGAGKSADASADTQLSFGDTQKGKCNIENNHLFDVLRAIDRNENARHALNQRQQIYFSDKKAIDPKNPRDGFADGKDFSDSIQGQFLDPWGVQYCIVLDTDGDQKLQLSRFFSDQTDIIHSPAAAFSLGSNSDIGGKGYQGRLKKADSSEPPDDLVSW